MTDPTLEAIKARLGKATPGPWSRAGVTLPGITLYGPGGYIAEDRRNHESDKMAAQAVKDFNFCAHAPEDMGYLIARLEASEVEVDRLTRNLEGRDEFLVNKGLFMEFVDSLPKERPNSSTAPLNEHEGQE